VLVIGQQPVTDPADGAPVRQLAQKLRQRAGRQWLGSRAAGQGQEEFSVPAAADQAGAGREKLDRAVGAVSQYHAGGLGSGAGVIRRDQGREPLHPAGVVRLALRRLGLCGFRAPRDFGDAVRVKPAQSPPR